MSQTSKFLIMNAGKPIPVPAQSPFAHANQKGGRFRCRLPRDMRVSHCTAAGTMTGLCTQEGGPAQLRGDRPTGSGIPCHPHLQPEEGGTGWGSHSRRLPRCLRCPSRVREGEGHRGGGASQPPRRVPWRCWDYVRLLCEGARPVTWGLRRHLWIPRGPLSHVAFVCKRGRGSCSRDPLPGAGALGGGGRHSLEEGHMLKGACAVPPSVRIPAGHLNR